MASIGSAAPVYVPAPSIYDKWPAPTPTDDPQQKQEQPQQSLALTQAQQMKQLQHEGKSAGQIANALGLPLILVQSDIGETTAASTTTNINIKA